MTALNPFAADWRECLEAHLRYVIDVGDHNNEASLSNILLSTGFSETELREMRVDVLGVAAVEPMPSMLEETPFHAEEAVDTLEDQGVLDVPVTDALIDGFAANEFEGLAHREEEMLADAGAAEPMMAMEGDIQASEAVVEAAKSEDDADEVLLSSSEQESNIPPAQQLSLF